MDNKTKISIWGCCIERDIFGLTENTEFKVDKYISFSSPLSFTEKPIEELQIINRNDMKLRNNFSKRSMEFDIKKNAREYFFDSDAEWCLVDVADIRLDVLCSIINGIDYIVMTKVASYNQDIKNKIMYSLNNKANLVIKSPIDFEEEKLKRSIIDFSHILKQKYPTDRIIVNKVKLVKYYKTKEKILTQYGKSWKIETCNKLLDKATKWLIDAIPGCYIIEQPDNVIGDELHTWGPHPLHYVEDYYQYGKEAIKVIVSDASCKEYILDDLKKKYSAIFTEQIANLAKDMVSKYDIRKLLRDNNMI